MDYNNEKIVGGKAYNLNILTANANKRLPNMILNIEKLEDLPPIENYEYANKQNLLIIKWISHLY